MGSGGGSTCKKACQTGQSEDARDATEEGQGWANQHTPAWSEEGPRCNVDPYRRQGPQRGIEARLFGGARKSGGPGRDRLESQECTCSLGCLEGFWRFGQPSKAGASRPLRVALFCGRAQVKACAFGAQAGDAGPL